MVIPLNRSPRAAVQFGQRRCLALRRQRSSGLITDRSHAAGARSLLHCLKFRDRKTFWKQFSVAFAAFVLAFLPAYILGLMICLTGKTHVYEPAPGFSELLSTLESGWLFFFVCDQNQVLSPF